VSTILSVPATQTVEAAGRSHPLPRVLYVLTLAPGKKYGSMEEQIVLLGQAFAREGGRFVPLFGCLPVESDVSQFTSRGLEAECLDLRTFRLSTLWKLLGFVRKHGSQIVHWNFMHPLNNLYLWGLTCLAPWLRHWYTDHISRTGPSRQPTGWKGWLKRLLLHRYSRVVCVSNYVQHCLEQQGVWSNLVTVPHFINTARFRPDPRVRADVRREHGVGEDFVLIAVGHLIPEKGFDVAIRALPLLPPRVVLWIVGEGPERDKLRHLADTLQVGSRVELLGLQKNVQPFLQAADAFVCPSRWEEAAGLVNLEAQACGVPMLGSRIGGIPEYLDEGRTGWLFEPDQPEALAELVGRLVTDSDRCRRMGQAARELALERFSPEARLPEVLALYRQM
jgi:glycosyltransferase involved in cell wall biosynthesis